MKLVSKEFNKHARGYLLIYVLIFGSVLFIIISSFVGYLLTQGKSVQQRLVINRSSEIAEAGLNYYRWFLAHHPNDVTNGTGHAGPYIHVYKDPELGPIGEFALTISSTQYCGVTSSIVVTSVGHTYDDPSISRAVSARYSQPTVAEYSFIINSKVWAGSSQTIVGPYHSNQGIRMDAANQSTVTSGVSTWSCDSSFGCSPTANKNGVFTSVGTSKPQLFAFPAPPINFTDLTIDLANMKTRAQSSGGVYLPPSGGYGYRIIFNGNGTFTARKVTGTYQYSAYSTEEGDFQERNIVSSDTLIGTYTINDNCPLIYIADKIWLEGQVSQKVTLAVDGVDSAGKDPSIILRGNITYTNPDTNGLLAIAENSVLLGVDVPDNMTINGIYIAQKGRFGRNLYNYSDLPNPSGPLDFRPYYQRTNLTINGTVVSSGRVGTQWTSGSTFVSGFRNRYSSYDRNLVADPPPLIPNTSDVYNFVEWREAE